MVATVRPSGLTSSDSTLSSAGRATESTRAGCLASTLVRLLSDDGESSSRRAAVASSTGLVDVRCGGGPEARLPGLGGHCVVLRGGLGAACGGGVRAGVRRLDPGHPAGGEGDDEQRHGADQDHAQPTDEPGLGTGLLAHGTLVLGRRAPSLLEERPFGVGERGAGVVLPVEGPRQPDAAVELAVGTPERVPRVGSGREVVADPLALDVVVEPGPEPGPGAGQGLVGDLEDAVVAGDQAGRDQDLDQPFVRRVGGDQAAGYPGADGCPLRTGRDQAQEEVAELVAATGLHRGVQALRGLRNRTPDAAAGAVAGDRQGVALPSPPGLEEGVGEQGQRAGVVAHLVHEEVDQPGFDDQPELASRADDRLP